MIKFGNYPACKVRVSLDAEMYSDLPKRSGTIVRFALYYRGFLVWKRGRDGRAISKAEYTQNMRADLEPHRCYRDCGNWGFGTYADGFKTRREAIEAIDNRLENSF
jgi:hypothetical protein